MAISPPRSKLSNHNRSISFPSNPNPSFSRFEEILSHVRASNASSLSSINNSLHDLKTVYGKIDEFLQSPHVRKTILSQFECHSKWADRVLDGLIGLLDACSIAKDHVSHTKQSVQDLHLALKRKIEDNIHSYLNSRKKSRKTILKSLKDLRGFKSSNHDETMGLVCMLKEAELVTFEMLESSLSYLIGYNKVQSMQTRCSLVSKLMGHRKKFSCDDESFEKLDDLLRLNLEGLRVEEITRRLKWMESGFGNLEEELGCLIRQLIKTRVCLLNLLNH